MRKPTMLSPRWKLMKTSCHDPARKYVSFITDGHVRTREAPVQRPVVSAERLAMSSDAGAAKP
jgi:hypothetical protein